MYDNKLYALCSRVSSSDSLHIMQLENKTKNVVYLKVLLSYNLYMIWKNHENDLMMFEK